MSRSDEPLDGVVRVRYWGLDRAGVVLGEVVVPREEIDGA